MKKYIISMLMAFIVFAINAQEETVNKDAIKGATYYKYEPSSPYAVNGSTVDTFSFILTLDSPGAIQAMVKTTFDLVTTADTTIAVTLDGKAFEDDTWTNIASGTFAASADGSTTLSTSNIEVFRADTTAKWHTGTQYGTYILKKTNTYQFYRYLRLRYIVAGNDATGTGTYIDKIEFILKPGY